MILFVQHAGDSLVGRGDYTATCLVPSLRRPMSNAWLCAYSMTVLIHQVELHDWYEIAAGGLPPNAGMPQTSTRIAARPARKNRFRGHDKSPFLKRRSAGQ